MCSPTFSGFILLLTIIITLEMEKEAAPIHNEHSKAYACFEEPETLNILNFLEVSEEKVAYKGVGEDQARRQKDFPFESVSFLTEKLRLAHGPIVQGSVEELLEGNSSTVLIMGNDESKKEKVLIGQSQNPGFLLQVLSALFETCYHRELEDRVTIKLSCWEHREGKIGDLLGGTGSKVALSNWIARDRLEGDTVVGVPEIIIRNMKTALKVIRIFMKSLEVSRQHGEETQNLVFTVKLEIDNAWDKVGNPTQYLISKLHIVKLSLPYYPRTPSKHAPWFVTLFNFMQAQTLQKVTRIEEPVSEDEFSSYLKDTLVRGVSSLHLFTIFSNKMTANDCLSALKFSSYLQNLKVRPRRCVLKVPQLLLEKTALEADLARSYQEERQWAKEVCKWLLREESSDWLDLELIATSHHHLMQAFNLLEFQYANLLTGGCNKLEKYIYTEEVEDYFYAKKVVLQPSPELQTALARYFEIRKKIQEYHSKVLRKAGTVLSRVKKEANQSVKEWKYLLNSKIKGKMHLQKLFDLYSCLSSHFLYDKSDAPFAAMAPPAAEEEELPQQEEISVNIEQIVSKLEDKEAQRNRKEQSGAVQAEKEGKKKRAVVDQTEMMFTNPNVGVKQRKKH